jgi:preprotein translocase subunit SecF
MPMSFYDSLYTNLISKAPYKVLAVIPPALSAIMLFIVLSNGLVLGLDFKGGTWIEVLTPSDLNTQQLSELEVALTQTGLEDVEVSVGWDVDTGFNKLVATTTTVYNDTVKEQIKNVIKNFAGVLSESDQVTITLGQDEKLPVGFSEKLNTHLNQRVDVQVQENTLTIKALNLDEAETERVLSYYLERDVSVEVVEKNYNQKTVGPTLGETFRRQGFKAIFYAFLLMALVIFVAFRDPIPSIAVMLAASCDIILTAGAMSVFAIPLEPASLAAILMLIGYSVDSDILLTVRTLKRRGGEINQRIDDAMKTGLTMTGTTLAVMVVVYIVSTTLTQIHTLSNIAQVLLIGLVADLFTTWFTNAGILKWYLEKPGGKKHMWGGR